MDSVPTIFFRVDASNRIGTGHVVRCLALAGVLRQRGMDCWFVHRKHHGNLTKMIRGHGFDVKELPAPERVMTSIEDGDYAAWLGVDEGEDAEQTIHALGDKKPEWLVVDHYGLGVKWEHRVRSYVKHVFVIDDLVNRFHDCDLLLNQNYGNFSDKYCCYLPRNTKTLLGPSYAMLGPEYYITRKWIKPRDGRIKRVLIFFGGSDLNNITRCALQALNAPIFEHLELNVVLGKNNPYMDEIESVIVQRPNARIYHTLPHLADLMIKADLMLSGGGTTIWESCCMGLPNIVVALAENQKSSCDALHASGYINYLGAEDGVDEEDFIVSIEGLLAGPDKVMAQSRKMYKLVSGDGAKKVAEQLLKA